VVNANPPFLVVHTNAAFCRLSGIDSHLVVGKPISSLLTIPDPQTIAELQEDHQRREQGKFGEVNGYDSTTGAMLRIESASHNGNDELLHDDSRETQGLSAAEAAGRARAAASQEDSVERLIATSGFGRYIIISLNARPLLGQKFTISKPAESAQSQRGREEGSNGSSITSNCEASYRLVPCKSWRNSIEE
jgi:PAS domain-containing protein